MTIAGWVFMGISWITIVGLLVICMKRVLSPSAQAEQDETPLEQ